MPQRGIMLWMMGVLMGGSTLSCAKRNPDVNIFESGDSPRPKDYRSILETWTRSNKLYTGWGDVLFVDATYHSAQFRRAFAVSFPDVYGQGGEVTRRELVDLPGDIERFHTFLISAYTGDWGWNDMDELDSIWRLTLSDGRLSVPPAEITKVKIDQNLREVYPHIGHFDQAYLARFPLTDSLGQLVVSPESDFFELRIASSMGSAVLNWGLKRSD